MFYKLMLVTDKKDMPLNDYLAFVQRCVAAGITSVQLREKRATFDELLDMGRQLQDLLKPLSIPLIVNDNLALARAIDADGLHLGQSDGCVFKARELLGPDKLLGVSVDSMDDLLTANQLPVDYVGAGAIFPTRSKANVAKVWGLEGLSALTLASKHPVVAIGGIDEHNAEAVMKTGAAGIAAIAVFHDAVDPARVISLMRSAGSQET